MSIKLKLINALENYLERRISSLSNYMLKIKEYKYFDALEERNDDIFVVTFLKSGTTWMQMILYQLTTEGKMDFNHIYDVSPWIRNEAVSGKDPERINQLPSPRIFKSHDKYQEFGEGSQARFIYVYRNGMDVAVSLHHHRRNYNKADETLEETLDQYFNTEKEYNWYNYSEEWLANSMGLNILYISYEELKADLESAVKKIAQFLGIELDKERLDRVLERSSFEFMKTHETKFGEQPKHQIVYNNFIRKGETGEGKKKLNEQQQKAYEDLYAKHIARLKNQRVQS